MIRFQSALVKIFPVVIVCCCVLYACKDEDIAASVGNPATEAAFGSEIDLNNLANYEAQGKPAYINKDNTAGNPITDKGATLGRVLFYDKNLSIDNTISCGSCHKQEFAFGDNVIASEGVNGLTGRHSMRLVNSRFSRERRFFWDERAATLENQTSQPIQDHKEMGFSGTLGDPAMSDLLAKLSAIKYYQELFKFVYGDEQITEIRMQNALAQFVRSIQSFDTRYDAGRALAPNDNAPFVNFSALENQGKTLFLAPPQFDPNGIRTGGGAGCQGCHQAPEFDIDPNSRNNGIIATIGSPNLDLANTRSPSLRDMVNGGGALNSQAMHDASLTSLESIIDHYNVIVIAPGNNNLDPKLTPGGNPQQLQLTQPEKDGLIAFLKTLGGSVVYTDSRWSDPFM